MILDIGDKREKGVIDEFMIKIGSLVVQECNW